MRLLLACLLCAAPARAYFWDSMGERLAKPRSLFEAGKYAEVIAELSPEALQRFKRGALGQAYLYLGMSYLRSGRRGEALSTYQLAVKLFPKDINLLSELGDLLHQTGLDEQAEPVFQKVARIHPNNARAHLGLAEIDRSLGLLDESADHYEHALESFPEQAATWRAYAEVLLASRDLTTADLAARKALALSDEPDSRLVLAFVDRAGGKLDEALGELDAALKADPARADIALTRGLWLLEAGRYREARAAARERLAKDAGNPLALWIDARVSLREDRYNDAVRALRLAAKAVQRAPFIAEAAQALLVQLEAKP